MIVFNFQVMLIKSFKNNRLALFYLITGKPKKQYRRINFQT